MKRLVDYATANLIHPTNWVRIMPARGEAGPGGKPTIRAGTLGLRIFGLRELEYASTPLDSGFMHGLPCECGRFCLVSNSPAPSPDK